MDVLNNFNRNSLLVSVMIISGLISIIFLSNPVWAFEDNNLSSKVIGKVIEKDQPITINTISYIAPTVVEEDQNVNSVGLFGLGPKSMPILVLVSLAMVGLIAGAGHMFFLKKN
ncbi:MAG: hypothetical protein PHQ98_01510 [Candidatus ainarchaeum sp.]|nr:hypothetical protein [Candidatus ainarchaeum sp.]